MTDELRGMTAKQKEKWRKPLIKEFQKLEKKYGAVRVRYVCNWYFTGVRMELNRKKKINQLQKEIEAIKHGKRYNY